MQKDREKDENVENKAGELIAFSVCVRVYVCVCVRA